MNTSPFQKYIARFESLQEIPTEKELRNCIEGLSREQFSIDQYIMFSEHEYKRNIIYTSSKCELVILCFKPGQYTPIHDHGGSVGIAFIYEGIMTEELFDKQLSSGMIVPSVKKLCSANEASCIDVTTIHRVSNTHNDGLVALNIYLPPLTSMNIYNLKNIQIEKWTAESFGKQDS
ncbi:MAG: hypothetical protein E3K37_01740 [Candidatus Kuenenia sp.]|nr:hypothetical protein [Candidatus Kuenenia hertensis]